MDLHIAFAIVPEIPDLAICHLSSVICHFPISHQPFAISHLLIAADHNIPSIETLCADLGEVRLFDSRDLAGVKRVLREAEALLCRSTIRVGEDLLAGTPVRFVATATAGTDHVDTVWLAERGIVFASAAGSNARSVAEWWAAAVLELQVRGRIFLAGASVGIVGVGHVGAEVADVARALGLRCLYNDPPRQRRREQPVPWDDAAFSSLDDILACDIVSLHVPLEREGEFATAGFFGAEQFRRMRPGALFINAARGGVIVPDAVLDWAGAGNPLALDVFPGEPAVDPALVRAADLATPHIAGHAWDGKLRGTEMVVEALRGWLSGGTEGQRHKGTKEAEGRRQKAEVGVTNGANLGTARTSARGTSADRTGQLGASGWVYAEVVEVVRSVCDVRIDDAALREAVEMGQEEAAAEFARLRAEYRVRREFATCTADGATLSADAAAMLRALGFAIT